MLSGEQLRAARAIVRMEQVDLAKKADVSVETIKRLERTIGPISANTGTAHAIQSALEAAGVEFIPENGGGAGVRLRKTGAPPDHPKPAGPATDVVERMDAAIEAHRGKKG